MSDPSPGSVMWVPDTHPNVPDNGPRSDIRRGLEARSKAVASRYYALCGQRVTRLQQLLNQNVTWGYTHNGSSWAVDVVVDVTGDEISSDTWIWFIENPVSLNKSIQALCRGPGRDHLKRFLAARAVTAAP
ncbi:hypothetical protein HNR56_000048 [Roseospira marina]|nr:hypothetical protein [Roseospira marina]MBB4312608.1 hypothetical protein [Roseospira marina]MBB5085376.1 hypothetical protein [Roseospira marina]